MTCQYKIRHKKKCNCNKNKYTYKCLKLDLIITDNMCEGCRYNPIFERTDSVD